MKKLVAVVGNRNSGKSTIIKSLTGCKKRSSILIVKDRVTGRSIYVVCSSPQEDPRLTRERLGRIFKKAAARDNCEGVVMAIQPNNPRKKPSMEDVLVEAEAHRFDVSVFVIDPGRSGDDVDRAVIQERLANLGIVATAFLDGRNFSFINAQRINNLTQIISEGADVVEAAEV